MHEREFFLTNIIYPPFTDDDMVGFVNACSKVIEHKEALLEARGAGTV
jgi:hypothetical protein